MTMGFDLWKKIKTSHYALMGLGVVATGIGLLWDGPKFARGALIILGLVTLAVTAVLMERYSEAQKP